MFNDIMTDQPTKPDWPPPDLTITAAEIAEVLAPIAQIMVSDGVKELAGRNASWYSDAAEVIERLLDQAKKDSD